VKEPAPDIVVAGKYLLEGQLATGGMGSVWVGRHLDLDVPVAIKFMGPECASSEEGRVRFEREAKAAALLQSPHVVNVQDYGVDDGLPYIVMELLVGEDLEDRLRREKRISLEATLAILVQASKALRRAQDLGIVHRDIKPHNLFLATGDDGEEILKVLDFGIAKETGPVLLAKGSNTGQIIGSPNYMSPEHVRGAKDIDHRADLWSLGVIAFQAVTGRLPFPGEIVGDVMGMILADPIPLATAIAPDLPLALDAFFLKALSRDRAQRFQSAREMTEAFAEIVRPPSSLNPPLFSQPTPSLPGVAAQLAAEGSVAAISQKPASLAPASLDSSGEVSSGRIESTLRPKLPSAAGARMNTVGSAGTKASPPRARRGAFAAVIGLVAVGGVLLILRGSGQRSTTGEPGTASSHAATAGADAVQDPAKAQATAPTAEPSESASSQAQPETPVGPAATTSGSSGKPLRQASGKGTAGPKASASSKPKRPWGF
jgi:serine/threonine protein kinase